MIRATSRRSHFRPCSETGSAWAFSPEAPSGLVNESAPTAPFAAAMWKWKSSRPYFSIPKEHASMADAELVPRAPFSGLALSAGTGTGILATDRDGLGLATVSVRNGQGAALSRRVEERFGLLLPDGPRRAAAG